MKQNSNFLKHENEWWLNCIEETSFYLKNLKRRIDNVGPDDSSEGKCLVGVHIIQFPEIWEWPRDYQDEGPE